ncbi:hypothetical protein [Spiroplasma diminutum]|nr:hypothetical protein [Spiroplasma diminutum]
MNKIFNENIELKFELNPFQIYSLKINEKEVIYQKNSNWNKSWPILFPVCGNINGSLEYNGKTIGLERHGFFKDITNWKIIDQKDSEIRLEYIFEEKWYKIYPFKFRLELFLILNDKTFEFNIKVQNLQEEDMYFSLGHHPGFIFNQDSKISLNKEEYFTDDFEGGLVSSLEKNIRIKDITFNNLDFTDSKSYMKNSFTKQDIIFNNKDYNFKISTNDFNDLIFWRESNECNFICIENWNGIPDLLNKKSNELKDKEGIITLKKNQEKNFLLEIKF